MGTSVNCNLNNKTFAAHTCTGDRHSVTTSHLRFPLDCLASSQTSKGNSGCRRERDMIRNDRGSTRPPLHIPQIPRGARYRHKQLRDHRPHAADPRITCINCASNVDSQKNGYIKPISSLVTSSLRIRGIQPTRPEPSPRFPRPRRWKLTDGRRLTYPKPGR